MTTPTYEEAIRCPRCGRDGNAGVEGHAITRPGERQMSVFCNHRPCPFFGRLWFLTLDDGNRVLYHTHTPYPS